MRAIALAVVLGLDGIELVMKGKKFEDIPDGEKFVRSLFYGSFLVCLILGI